MLSVLIPTYNYNITPLVKEILKQCIACNIIFEILVFDDGSNSSVNEINASINNFKNCTFKILPKNIGRSAIRNKLARAATYDWLLFLDVDVIPKSDDFVANYLKKLPNTPIVIYGGIEYTKNKPEPRKILRWKYGNKREALSITERNKDKYLRFLTLNFVIHKSLFNVLQFNENIPNSRHEDTLFALELEKNKVNLKHINNPIIHLGIEDNLIFIKKSLDSVDAAFLFYEEGLIKTSDIFIIKTYSSIRKLGIKSVLAFAYRQFRSIFEKHLLSGNPNLLIFDFYRLCYLCNIKLK